jgi:HSP20 family protein
MNTLNALYRLNKLANPARAYACAPSTTPVDDFVNAFFQNSTRVATPTIALDIHESEAAYRIIAALPGVKKEDIQVQVEKNILSLSAEFKSTLAAEESTTIHRERQFGRIERRFTLADDIDDTKIEAQYVDGLLTLVLPKKQPVSATRITIN